MKPNPRQPGERAGLTHRRVLRAARELLRDRGPDALSMRALAHKLEVAPNTLYSHVENKTALIDELLDDALAEVKAPPPDSPEPVHAMHALMTSTYDVLLDHAELLALYLTRQGARGPNAQHLGEIMLALLDRIGLTGPRAREALHVLIVYTIGAAAYAARAPLLSIETPSPALREQHATSFDHGLRWILAGITDAPDLAKATRPSRRSR